MKIRRVVMVSLIGFSFLAVGCDPGGMTCQIKMTPKAELLERELRISRPVKSAVDDSVPVHDGVSIDRIEALEKIYQQHELTEDGLTHVFLGLFKDKTPADLGGVGRYVVFPTSLGSTYYYMERLGGQPNQAPMLEGYFRQADEVTDHILGWAAYGLKDEEGYDKLRQFIDVELRRGLKNLILYAYINQSLGPLLRPTKDSQADLLVPHSMQYLIEREYISKEDIPVIYRCFYEHKDDSQKRLFKLVQRFVAKKMGIGPDERVPDSLAFLSDEKQLQESAIRYLESTPEYADQIKQWKRKAATQPATTRPSGEDILPDMDFPLLPFDFDLFVLGGSSANHLMMRLVTSVEPFSTNGSWDEEKAVITWHPALQRGDKTLPDILYAVWAQPAVKAQKKHFGKLVLAEEELSEYCLWHTSLTGSESKEWESFLKSLQPGPNLEKQIEQFRFSGEPTEPEPGENKLPKSYANRIKGEIIRGLSPQATTQPTTQPTTVPTN